MKTITTTTNVYKFNELNDDAKQAALDELYSINVEYYDWWEQVKEDLSQIHCKLVGFDIDRGSYCELKFNYADQVIEAILKNHGETCETYKIAKRFENQVLDEDERWNEDAVIEFKQELENEYLTMLRNEYDYLTSEVVILETIEVNDYDFTEDGKLF